MKIATALNYMKVIINNGKKNNCSPKNVRKGLDDYLGVLSGEGAITEEDKYLLFGVVSKIDEIMNSGMTVDEAFVRSMCALEGENYVGSLKKSKPKKKTVSEGSSKEEFSKPTSKPARNYEPRCDGSGLPMDGSCGRWHLIELELKRKEEEARIARGCDGIWSKCR